MIRRVLPVAILLGLGGALTGAPRAEVSVPFGPPGSTGPGPMISIIGDSPDPFPDVWNRLSSPSSGGSPLNPAGSSSGDGFPSAVVNPVTGDPIVAWSRASMDGFDVVVSRFHDGSWSDPSVVAGSPEDELDPRLVVSNDGTVHLVYWTDGLERSVFYVRAGSDASDWSTATRVSDPGVEASRPSVTFHDGSLRVAYERHDSGYGVSPKSIVVSREESGEFVAEIVAFTSYPGAASPRVGSHSGRLWVDWIDAVDPEGAGELAWVRLEANGPDATRYVPFAGPFEREFHVRPGIRLLAVGP